jgi:quercetin dioxygenase-like cupin family protein
MKAIDMGATAMIGSRVITLLGGLAGLLFALLGIVAPPLAAQGQELEVKTLVTKDLAGAIGQEALMLTVEYPPGGSEPVHRHNAQAFVYILEGSVVMQVKGQPAVTLKAGETFYEGRDDVHLVGRNASQTDRARFVVFLVKEKGTPVAVAAP